MLAWGVEVKYTEGTDGRLDACLISKQTRVQFSASVLRGLAQWRAFAVSKRMGFDSPSPFRKHGASYLASCVVNAGGDLNLHHHDPKLGEVTNGWPPRTI